MTTKEAPWIIAHRGASHDAPENTLAAFRLAWEQQCDGIEGDFFLTADQQIVCIHDPDTKRTTGARLRVERSTLAQLRALDAGRWKDPKWTGEKIPTFAEVLETVPPSGRFVIELKGDSAIVPVLAAELDQAGTDTNRVLIISLSSETVRQCKTHMPNISTHWLTKLELGDSLTDGRPSPKQVANTMHTCQADGIGMKAFPDVIDEAFVRQLNENGCMEFHVFTVDAPDDARYFQQLGAVGITTNRPSLIRSAIRSVN